MCMVNQYSLTHSKDHSIKIEIEWRRCDEYPEYVPIKEMAIRCIDENRIVFDRLAQI